MRNNIDKETYDWLFKILMFFGIILAIITTLLMIDLKGFAPKTINVASSLLFLLLGVSLWIRVEYLKLYNLESYNTKKVPMWLSAFASFVLGLVKLF